MLASTKKGFGAAAQDPNATTYASPGPGAFSISIFSKTLHWMNYQEMADAVAEMGFDGIDLTVRPEGHVVPERVADDLPRAFEAIKKAGLNIYMITTAINRADDPFTQPILKTAGSLGIPFYRMGWIAYDEKKSIEDNLKIFKDEMTKLAALNKTYGIHGGYQNHSGMSFGSPVWDLWTILKELDPQWIGSQYDVLHATVEGANSWPLGLRSLKSYIRTVDIKDFYWTKKDNQWRAQVVPLGEGMIDFGRFFRLLKDYNISAPLSMHFEYPLGGAEHGAKNITMNKEEVLNAMKQDVITLKRLLRESGVG